MKRTTPLTRHIGGKVREYRLKNGWTQTELAARMQVVGCDLSREIIARIESGFRQTSVFEIDKFVEVFGTPTTTYSHNNISKMAEAGKAIFPASLCPGKTILAISSVVRGLPKRIIYFSSSVQSRASRMVVHFSYLSSLLLSEYAWLLVASCTAR